MYLCGTGIRMLVDYCLKKSSSDAVITQEKSGVIVSEVESDVEFEVAIEDPLCSQGLAGCASSHRSCSKGPAGEILMNPQTRCAGETSSQAATISRLRLELMKMTDRNQELREDVSRLQLALRMQRPSKLKPQPVVKTKPTAKPTAVPTAMPNEDARTNVKPGSYTHKRPGDPLTSEDVFEKRNKPIRVTSYLDTPD